MHMRLFAPTGLALTLLLALPATGARAGGGELTARELQKLSAGELVTRPTEERRGRVRMIGGSSWQVIDAPQQVVWRALLDTQYYPRMLPEVDEARVIRQTADGQRTVFMHHEAGFINASYYLAVQTNAKGQDIRFRIDSTRPHDLRAAWGVYALRPYGKGRSLLAYRVMADIGGGLLGMLVEPLLHKWLLRVPLTVKRFVEGSGRHIYKY